MITSTPTHKQIFTNYTGIRFELVGIKTEGTLLEVIKALYGLPTYSKRWHANLSNTLREMGFKPTCFDLDVWITGREGGYNYIRTHANYVLLIAVNPTSIFGKLNETYTI